MFDHDLEIMRKKLYGIQQPSEEEK